MNLNYLAYDSPAKEATPLVILHGLFGAGDNWATIAKALSEERPVYAPDLPNHGASPHNDRFEYPDVAADVADWLRRVGLNKVILLGHSMGGKVGMSLALHYPQLVAALIVADIAPKTYRPRHGEELKAMEAVRDRGARDRREADGILAEEIDNRAIRAFLLKNYRELDGGAYGWRFNLDGVREWYAAISAWPEQEGAYPGPTLFVRGGRSPYVEVGDAERVTELFPRAELVTIEEAGHWLHAERRDEFLSLVRDFLENRREREK